MFESIVETPQDGPRGAQEAPRRPQEAPKRPQDPSKSSQETAKSAPGGSKKVSRDHKSRPRGLRTLQRCLEAPKTTPTSRKKGAKMFQIVEIAGINETQSPGPKSQKEKGGRAAVNPKGEGNIEIARKF